MKILELSTSGFRSLKKVQQWEPGSLNVLIGPNASGKSNLLRLLEFISAAATGKLGATVQEAGGMGAVCWDNQKNSTVSFHLKTSPLKPGGVPETQSLTYDVELSRLGEGANFRVNTELLARYSTFEKGTAHSPFKFLERRRGSAHVFDETKKDDGKAKGLVRVPDDALQDDETALSIAGNPLVGSFLQNWVLSDYQRHLAGWSVYHAFGSHPESIIRRPLAVRNEKRVSPDGGNLLSVLNTLYNSSDEFHERIDEAMRVAFPDCYKRLLFPPVADNLVQLAIQFSGLAHPTPAVGLSDGTLRFLFLMTVLGSPEAASLIAVDEPEIGLHPSMLSVIAEFAVEASKRSQVIISTHSEALLNSFTDTLPVTTVVKWNQGATSLTKVPGEQLADWLKSYSLGALFASGELESVS